MRYVIMRKDLSGVLSDENGWMTFIRQDIADETARNFSGVVKTLQEAEIIIQHNIDEATK